ncbi:MAG: Translation elongation factor Lys34:lysine transferase, partial [bacterium]|nr:Translation elongation factor Lys34:lysine transferase [bacterium]
MTERERVAGKKLRERSILNRTIRAFFDAREFIEIEAPILVPSPGLELHLDAFAVENRYLITSPEYQM